MLRPDDRGKFQRIIDSTIRWAERQLSRPQGEKKRELLNSLRGYAERAAIKNRAARGRRDFVDVRRRIAKIENTVMAFLEAKILESFDEGEQ